MNIAQNPIEDEPLKAEPYNTAWSKGLASSFQPQEKPLWVFSKYEPDVHSLEIWQNNGFDRLLGDAELGFKTRSESKTK